MKSADAQNLPLLSYNGKIVVVTDPLRLWRVLQEIKHHRIAGFDTETRPVFVKGKRNKVALLQLALPHKVFLIRLTHTGIPDVLVDYFEDEQQLKIGIAVRDDVKALQRLRRFTPQGFVELTALTKAAGYTGEGIRSLTAQILGHRISKSAQTSNWEAPTLTEKQLRYAATDAWVCLEMYRM
ncbi:MAG: 3'-5' exonuclease, partial [Cyclobacteriaceae bacterium]|nr:3'-5' exonuclease [Cyclobacteriaceae bacterium]